MDIENLHEFIRRLVTVSAEIIRPCFVDPNLVIERKADQSLVTEADREAERAMRETIRSAFPEHGIIGEEFGEENATADYVWVLDPIDGTKPFVAGCPLFGTLICLVERGQPILGAIHNPVLDLLLTGDNTVAKLNGNPVTVSETAEPVSSSTG